MAQFPDDQSNPAGAIPVYLVLGGAAVSGGNALPTTGGGGGGSDITTGTTVIDSNPSGTVNNPYTQGMGNLFTMIVDKTAGSVTYYVFGTTTVGSPVGAVYPFVIEVGQMSIVANQAALPTNSGWATLLSNPASVSMAALNAAVQWQVEGGQNYILSLVNSPAATTAWVGTVSFQFSLNGSSWSALNALPMGLPTGQAVTTSTVNGIWLLNAPSGATVYIRALMSAYTSGTVNALLYSQAAPNLCVNLPWTYSVTSGQTIVGPFDATGISTISVQISAITTTVLTAQGSNDITGTTWVSLPVNDIALESVGALTLTAASTYSIKMQGFKYFRLQCTTTGTVLTIQGIIAKYGQIVTLTGYGDGITANVTQIGGTNVVTGGVAGIQSVGGNVAHSAARTANPITVGGQVTTTLDTTLVQGDVSYLMMTSAGQLIEKPYGSAENDWQYTISTTTTTSAVAAKAAGAASIRNYVTGIQVQNTSVTATTLLIQDGATTILQINLPASMLNPTLLTFPTPLRGTAATAMNYNFGTAGATVLLNVQGYQSF